MPDIKFYCAACRKKLAIDSAAAGYLITCPGCGKENRVPAQSQEKSDAAVSLPQRPLQSPTRHSSTQPIETPPAVTTKADDVERHKLLSERDEALRKLAHLEKEKEQWAADKKSLTAQLDERDRQLIEAKESAKSTAARLADAEQHVQNLKAANDDALSGQSALAVDLKKLRDELAVAREQLAIANTDKKRTVELQRKLDAAEKISADSSAKITALTAEIRDREQRLNDAKLLAAKAEARITELEKESEQRKQLLVKLDLLAEEGKKAAAEKDALRNEIQGLKSEHAILIGQLQESRKLTASMDNMRTQIAELQSQEKQLEKIITDAESKKKVMSIPAPAPLVETPVQQSAGERWPKPTGNLPRKLSGLAAAAVVLLITGLITWWFWPRSDQSPLFGDSNLTGNQAISFGGQEIDLTFKSPAESDGVEFTFTGARIAPVTLVSISGRETTSEQRYLIIDVHVVNRLASQSISFFRTWQDARILDSDKKTLKQAFNETMPLGEEIKGASNGRELTAGNEINDMIIFEWNNEQSPEFTMKCTPTFWVHTTKDSLVPKSNLPISLKIPADSITGR